jgi:hypothetical protein
VSKISKLPEYGKKDVTEAQIKKNNEIRNQILEQSTSIAEEPELVKLLKILAITKNNA